MASLQDLWAIFNQDETPYQYQQVRGGGDFGAGYNVGSAIAQNIQNARINRRNNQRRNDSRGQAINGIPGSNGSANGGAVTGAIGADENGVYGIPQQKPTTVIGADENGIFGMSNQQSTPNVLFQGSPNWTTPNQKNGFNTIFGSDSNTGAFNSNPQSPVASSVDQALTGGGTITSASLYGQPQQQRQDMSNLRDIQKWMEADRAQGVTNPIISMMRYQAFMEPMEKQRREDNLRDAFATLRNPEATEEQIMNAYATLEYELKRPGLKEDMERREDEFYARQGMIRNPNYSSNGGSSAGNNILSALGDYEEGEQWMSPDGTGNSRTQCSNWVSDVLRKAGIKGLGHANGDELMRQFGNAYHEGLDGIQPGDVLNFKDHVGIYAGNGQYVARNSSGGVHQGSMEEAIQYFGQPLGYGSVGEYTGTSRNQKYIKDPNAMTKERLLGLRHKYNMEEIEARNAYRNKDNGTTVNEDGYVKGSGKRNNSLINGINWYANNKDSAKAEDIMKNFVDPMSEVFVDKLIQFKNEGDALEQLAYELVGGEKYGSSGMSDDALAEVISEAAMKAGNSERIRYTFSGKNAIKQKLLKDILPRLHGTTPSTEDGASGEKSGTKTGDGKIKPKKYNPEAKGGSSSSNGQTTLEEHKQDDPHYDDNGDNLALRQDLQQNGFARVFGRYVPQKYPNYDDDLN